MKKLTEVEWIMRFRQVHGDRYDYSSLQYVNASKKVNISCRTHGDFKQLSFDHEHGFGCPHCSGKARLTKEKFITKAIQIHADLYDYSQADYISLDKDVNIICKKHGIFTIAPRYHLYGTRNGCPTCNLSKGELRIKQLLIETGIEFEQQKKFENFFGRFDFFIPSLNTVIEYDGSQHSNLRHQRCSRSNQLKSFLEIQKRDALKDQYCLVSNVRLVRIPYTQYNSLETKIKNLIWNISL